jgi:predicted HTH transcriptional regulator
MILSELNAQVALGEDSRRPFKQGMQSPDALAAEMTAFANSEGGVIFLGVADDGSLPGLSRADVSRVNQMMSNVAAQHVRSPLTVQTENVELENGRLAADFCPSASYTILQHGGTVHTRTWRAPPRHTSLVWHGQRVGAYTLWNPRHLLLRIFRS